MCPLRLTRDDRQFGGVHLVHFENHDRARTFGTNGMLNLLRQVWLNENRADSSPFRMNSFCESHLITLTKGAHARFYFPTRAPHAWVLSLHGGPESYEDQEIRYGGLYLDLQKKGMAVVVLNYRGSKKEGSILGKKEEVWGQWKKSLYQDYDELLQILPPSFAWSQVIFLGPSFGGALALLLGQSYPHRGIVLFSPLLDLKTQIKRGGKKYAVWFKERFSVQDCLDISLRNLAPKIRRPVFFAFGNQDEVLGSLNFSKFARTLRQNPKNLILPQDCGHAPQRYFDYSRRYREALQFIESLSISSTRV